MTLKEEERCFDAPLTPRGDGLLCLQQARNAKLKGNGFKGNYPLPGRTWQVKRRARRAKKFRTGGASSQTGVVWRKGLTRNWFSSQGRPAGLKNGMLTAPNRCGSGFRATNLSLPIQQGLGCQGRLIQSPLGSAAGVAGLPGFECAPACFSSVFSGELKAKLPPARSLKQSLELGPGYRRLFYPKDYGPLLLYLASGK